MAAAAAACFSPEPTPRPAPAPTVNPADLPDIKHRYITAQFQMELTNRMAHRDPHDFDKALSWQPDPNCVDIDYLTSLETEELPYFAQDALNCLRRDLNAADPKGAGGWQSLDTKEIEKRIETMLEVLWTSQSPDQWLAWQVATSRGYAVAPGNNPALANFAESYRHCRPTLLDQNRLTAPVESFQTAQLWLGIADRIQTCVNRKHEVNFPLEHQPSG